MNRERSDQSPAVQPITLVVPVGGQWEAPLAAVRSVRPERVIFLASSATEKHLADIRQSCEFTLQDVDWIVTPDHESVSETLRILNRKLPEILAKWHVDWPEVTIDLTGGTKAMVAALMLASIHRARYFMYIGGQVRTGGGTGSVVPGSERPVRFFNPWDETAEEALRQIYRAFNTLQFATAAALAKKAASMVSEENKSYLKRILALTEGFEAWDRFDHRTAGRLLHQASEGLTMAWRNMHGHELLVPQLLDCRKGLDEILGAERVEAPWEPLLRDVLANAWRRGTIERRFDDAVARLYRFIEGKAQQALWDRHGIKTASVPYASLPPGDEWVDLRNSRPVRADTVAIALERSYSLLHARGDPLGEIAMRLGKEGDIGRLLSVRNQSLLAHGSTSVHESDFSRLFKVCLEVGKLTQAQLIHFPTLPE